MSILKDFSNLKNKTKTSEKLSNSEKKPLYNIRKEFPNHSNEGVGRVEINNGENKTILRYRSKPLSNEEIVNINGYLSEHQETRFAVVLGSDDHKKVSFCSDTSYESILTKDLPKVSNPQLSNSLELYDLQQKHLTQEKIQNR